MLLNKKMEGESYNVIQLQKYKGNLELSTRKFRNLEIGEVLIKVHCATIHPSDLFFLQGQYGRYQPDVFPVVPGFEGSGEIVKTGEGVDSKLVGKRCGFILNGNKTGSFEGTWSQYAYTRLHFVLVYDNEVDYEKICFSLINPLTACGMLDTLKKKGVNSVAQNGSSSAFGKMFIRLLQKEKITSVNLVRKEQHIETLKNLGGDYVLSTSDPNWKVEFQKLTKELNTTDLFECVGGEMTGTVLSLMPPKSTVFHYGNLEAKLIANVSTSDLIFQQKVLKGWYLVDWLETVKPEEVGYWLNYIKSELQSDSDLFLTKVQKRFSLEDYEKAFGAYLADMSEGKVILKPNSN